MPGSGGSRSTTRGIVVRQASVHTNWFTHTTNAPRTSNPGDLGSSKGLSSFSQEPSRQRQGTSHTARDGEPSTCTSCCLFPCSPSCELSCRDLPASHRRRVPETRRAESRPCRGCGGLAEGEEPREAKPGVSERFRYLQSALTERSAEPDAGLEAGAAGRRLEI